MVLNNTYLTPVANDPAFFIGVFVSTAVAAVDFGRVK